MQSNIEIKPPSAPEIESSVLGSIMIDNTAGLRAFQMIKPKHFYVRTNAIVYEVMLALFENDTPIDTITMYDALKKTGKLDECGGAVYLSKLSMNIPSSANIEYHCKILIEKWMYREMINISHQLAQKAYEGAESPFELASRVYKQLEDMMNVLEKKEELNFVKRLPDIFQKIEEERSEKIETTLKCKEYPSFNKATGGLRPGNMVLISGPTKASKTRFAFSLLRDYAVNVKVPVGLIGLEMDTDEYDRILLSMQTQTRYDYLRDPASKAKDGHLRFSADKLHTMKQKAIDDFKDTKIFISDNVFLDIELFAKIHYWHHKYGVRLVAVDYIQLVPTNEDMERRDMVVAHISRNLKNICRQLKINIIEISQENDRGRTAEGKGPEKDCDFWFSCIHPSDDGTKSIKMQSDNELIDVPIDESIFQVRFKASRHSPNGGSFLTKFFENGEYKEYDYRH
jgi:replicative DNA helicase